MTLVHPGAPPDVTTAEPPRVVVTPTPAPQLATPVVRVPRTPRPRAAAVASSLTVVAALLLGLVAQVVLLGGLQHRRDQAVAYDDLRLTLAAGTAPVGQTTSGPEPALVPLGTPVALLEVPVLELSEVVLEGTTADVLTRGPGHRRDTVLPGQTGTSVLFGRRAAYGGPFADVPGLQAGDEVVVTTAQGRQVFLVTGTRRAGDPQPVPDATAARLTLVTAAGSPFLPDGVVRVDAELVGDPMPTPARVLPPGSLPDAEQPLSGDRSALVPLVLWGQLLLVAVLALTWLRVRWGRWQTWVVAVPVLLATGTATADAAARLLPNLL